MVALRGLSRASSLVRPLSSASARRAGRLYICGTGEYNKLGVGDQNDREAPVVVEDLRDVPVTHVACGKYHTAAVAASGEVYMWGHESSGQLGLGSAKTKAPTPRKVDALSGIGVRSLSCGTYHTLALTDSGEVYACGFGGSFFNGAGGLGLGDRRQRDTPEKLPAFGPDGGATAASISAGGYHSSVMDTEGRIHSFGRGEWGRLGFGDSSDVLNPEHLEEADRLRPQCALVGESHSACLGEDGKVFTWGRNEHWQLGYEVSGFLNSGQSFDAQSEPTEVPMPEGSAAVRILACSEQGTAVYLSDRSVYVWGMRRYFEPTAVPNAKESIDGEVAQLLCGSSHVVLRTECGKVYTYGKGTALAMARADRKQWELAEVTATALEGKKVIQVAAGSNSTAFIVDE